MKVVVISDTHGDIEKSIEVIKSIRDVDLFIHLGDYSRDAKKIQKVTGIDMINIKGNCDVTDMKTKEEEILEISNKKILITHGHKYGVKRGLDSIFYKAKELEANAVLFGHSHQAINLVEDDILIFNPGSISLPRGGTKKSYGILDIKEEISSKIVEL